MKNRNIDAYIIPNNDPNLGEYLPDHWKIVQWLTGFKGSSANIVVTGTFAGLWTDSRYFIQAKQQLADSGFGLMKINSPQDPSTEEWLCSNLNNGQTVGVDGRLISISSMRTLESALTRKKVQFDLKADLISDLWENRPPMPESIAFDHPISYAGKGRELKIAEVRERMRLMEVDYHLLTSADDIMWLLNIRGNDVQYSPLLISFAILEHDQVLLFTGREKIPPVLFDDFDRNGITILPYEATADALESIPGGSSILITPETTSAYLFNSIKKGVHIIEDISIPAQFKAVKNKTEIRNVKQVMIRDGVALTKFFFWLENNTGVTEITELSCVNKLLELRLKQPNCLGSSFSTIAAFNEHSALPHYSPDNESNTIIKTGGILLIDSGGQYFGGTTDITRSVALGQPSLRQKIDFTLVLKGMINLATAKFPAGTRGVQLDVLARKALWDNGLNYGHGTGHGVGFFLSVHEGPQSIGTGSGSMSEIKAGMLLSDEPGVYREGEYGFRTENLILCIDDEEPGSGRYLKFETLSLCYIDNNLIERTMLDDAEIKWVNDYHSMVYNKLAVFLTHEEQTWLKEKTGKI